MNKKELKIAFQKFEGTIKTIFLRIKRNIQIKYKNIHITNKLNINPDKLALVT